VQKWIALAEVVLANLAWLGDLDIEGWLVATAAAVAIGVAIWIFAGLTWLVIAASLYLALLVTVKLLVDRRDRRADRRQRV
jgi:hypothetical protein